jgi:hypothetical protein
MRNLHKLKNSALIDMLAEYTLKFTHLFRIYKIQPNKEYQNYKKAIEKIIGELDKRGLIPKKDEVSPSNGSTTISSTGIIKQ